MGAGASIGDHVESLHTNLDHVEETLNELDDPERFKLLSEGERKSILKRLFNIMNKAHSLLDESGVTMEETYFDYLGPGKTRPNKTKAEELLDEVEMEAAVDDELNTLLFEFVEVYGAGDEEVDERVVSLFSRPEFNPSVVDSFGNSLIIKGIQENNDAFVQIALNFGVDPNLCNSAGVTALHLVCYVSTYDFDKAKLLCENGAEPALAVTSTGLTPLHYAVETRDPDIIKLLLDAGASPSVEGLESKTPLDYAEMCRADDVEHDGKASDGIVKIISMLEEAAAAETETTKAIDAQLHTASRERSKSMMKRGRRRASVSASGIAAMKMAELSQDDSKGNETRDASTTGSGMSEEELAKLKEENKKFHDVEAEAEELRKQNEELQRQAKELREMKAKMRNSKGESEELQEMRVKMEKALLEREVSRKQHEAKKIDEERLQKELEKQAREKEMLKQQLDAAKQQAASAGEDAANAAALESLVKDLSTKVEEAKKKNEETTRDLRREQEKRKELYNEVEDLKGKIRVFARIRPLNSKERKQGDSHAVIRTDPCSMKIVDDGKDGKVTEFSFDSVLNTDSTQKSVFADTKRVIQSAIDGYNVCIFAYGQTGAGKSFTMLGEPGQEGIQPRAINEIFRIVQRDEDRYSFKIKFYMLELYKGKFIDLLVPPGKQAATISAKRNPKGVVEVHGATTQNVESAKQLQDLINIGTANRHVSSTKMNEASSRSHLICAIMIESENIKTKVATIGKLSLVDLAGSERQSKTGATGETLAEAKSINKSLSALGNVIHALTQAKGGNEHVPYRNDPLTQLMADSLGGNAKTLMFVNVSPASSNIQETLSSLNFASRCKKVTNSVSATVETAQIRHLKRQIAAMKKGGSSKTESAPSKRAGRRSSFIDPSMSMG